MTLALGMLVTAFSALAGCGARYEAMPFELAKAIRDAKTPVAPFEAGEHVAL